jgi:hypothetical protein
MYNIKYLKKGNVFRVFPLASVWGSTVDLSVFFYLHVSYDPLISKINCLLPSISKYSFNVH